MDDHIGVADEQGVRRRAQRGGGPVGATAVTQVGPGGHDRPGQGRLVHQQPLDGTIGRTVVGDRDPVDRLGPQAGHAAGQEVAAVEIDEDGGDLHRLMRYLTRVRAAAIWSRQVNLRPSFGVRAEYETGTS